MTLEYFREIVFDALNECDALPLEDIETNFQANAFTLTLADGSQFEVACQAKTS